MGPGVVAGMLVFTAVVYGALPERLPTHWNMRGEVDGWSGRPWGALLMPVVALALWGLLPLLRKLDPRRAHYEKFDATFWLLVNLIVLFMAALHVLLLGAGLGWDIAMNRLVLVLVGLLFVALGNYLPRLRSNWWMGVRTPWTLDSESVWRSTHRVAGFTFVGAGLVMMVSALLPGAPAFGLAMGAVGVAAAIPVAYSFIAYRRERRDAPPA
jgi:uncharacterized membrane protein